MKNSNGSMETIRKQLVEEEQRIVGVISALSAELTGAKSQLKAVRDSLKPLTAGSAKSARKPSPTREEVSAIVGKLNDRTLSAAELRKQIEDELERRGRGKYGLAARISEALAEIEETTEGSRIVQGETSPFDGTAILQKERFEDE